MPLKQMVTPQEFVDILNDALATDNEAIQQLFRYHVDCNEAMTQHPMIQVVMDPMTHKGKLGILGILTSIFGIGDEGFGCIFSIVDHNHNILRFEYIPNIKEDENGEAYTEEA